MSEKTHFKVHSEKNIKYAGSITKTGKMQFKPKNYQISWIHYHF